MRALFGGDTMLRVTGGITRPNSAPLPATVWDAQEGGNQYTDLLAADQSTPITEVTVTGATTPPFYGPDDVLFMWLDTGDGGRELIRGSFPPGGASDPEIAALVNDPGSSTAAALSGTYARKRIIDANQRGIKADGTTDDAAAWNALIASCSPGDVITWTGRSMLGSSILWKSGVSLIGQGWGRSVLATFGPDSARHAAIKATSGDGFSETNTLDDITFKDFEVDGSGLEGTTYSIGAKAIYAQFMRRCQFLNLYLHDTVATALGVDFLPGCIIDGVLTERSGRLNTGGGGGAGIGIGTGAWPDEPLIISNCIARDGGKWGIFVEKQADKPYYSRGTIIANCVADGCYTGFNDSGMDGLQIVNCTSLNNTQDGFSLRYDARNGVIANCVAIGNGANGIYVPPEVVTGGYTFENNILGENSGRGIYLDANTVGPPGMTIRDNRIYRNGLFGISGDMATTGTPFRDLTLVGNRVYENGQLLSGSLTRGIKFDASITGFLCRGNDVYDRQGTKTQVVGMEFSSVSAYTLTDAVIEGNHFHDNGSVNFRFQSQTLSNVRARNNTGFVTEADGTGTIADGSASVTVTHGLAATPTTVTLGKRTSEDVWVSARTATTFTVTRTGTTGALTFDWSARYKV